MVMLRKDQYEFQLGLQWEMREDSALLNFESPVSRTQKTKESKNVNNLMVPHTLQVLLEKFVLRRLLSIP